VKNSHIEGTRPYHLHLPWESLPSHGRTIHLESKPDQILACRKLDAPAIVVGAVILSGALNPTRPHAILDGFHLAGLECEPGPRGGHEELSLPLRLLPGGPVAEAKPVALGIREKQLDAGFVAQSKQEPQAVSGLLYQLQG
jgi:hypothetical protein